MSNEQKSLTTTPAWQALALHYAKIENVHLRDLFAQDPARGVFILGLLVLYTGGALALYAVRLPALRSAAPFSPVSREGALTVNNALLCVATGTVFIGTFYPLLIDLLTEGRP